VLVLKAEELSPISDPPKFLVPSANTILAEYKIQDVHQAAILDFGWHWFSKGTFSYSEAQSTKTFQLNPSRHS
jgi:hypothetical protein